MTMTATNGFFLLASIITSLGTIFLMTLRWKTIISGTGIKTDYKTCFRSLAKGISLGMITPGKVGEFYRAKYMMEKTKKSIGLVFSTVVIDRILDIFVLMILGTICSIALIHLYLVQIPLWLILLFSGLVLAAIVIFLNERYMKKILLPLFSLFVPEKYRSKIHFHFNEFYKGVRAIKKEVWMKGLLATLLIWVMNFITTYLIIMSLGLDVPFWYVAIINPLMVLINLIPISVSGFGTLQASCIFLLGLRGISPEAAVAVSFLIILVGIWIYALPGAIFYALKK
jgi:uncharacterized protein (TIRG00374 family)